MREQLIRTENADYVPSDWGGRNESNVTPIGDMVLVLPDEASSKAGKIGLIHLPQDQVDRMSLASESGVVVELGMDAFSWNSDRTRPFAGKKPEPGNRVVFNRYAGRVLRGTDGKMYRLMTDNCIGAIMTMETDNA